MEKKDDHDRQGSVWPCLLYSPQICIYLQRTWHSGDPVLSVYLRSHKTFDIKQILIISDNVRPIESNNRITIYSIGCVNHRDIEK